MEAIVSKRKIEEKLIYRIHHIMDGQLIGLEAVEKTDDGRFRKIYNWNDGGEVEDFMNELEDIKMVSEFESKAVLTFLENFPKKGKETLEQYLKEADEKSTVHYFLSTPNRYYAFVKHETNSQLDGATYLRAYVVVLDRDGELRTLTPLENQADLEIAVTHLATELSDQERIFFQLHPHVVCGVKRDGDRIHFLFMEEVKEDEDAEGKMVSSVESVHTLIHNPETNEFTVPENDWTEEEKGRFVMEMMPIFTQCSPEEIIQN